jgi:hypothetical protein
VKVRMVEPFAKIPVNLLKNSTLSPWSRLLYPLLLNYNSEQGCFPGQDRLANDLGVSIDTIQRALGELAKIGLIQSKRRGRGHTNTYFLSLDTAPMRFHDVDDTAPMRFPDTAPMRHNLDLVELESNPPTPKQPKPRKERLYKDMGYEGEQQFIQFWEAYPRKVSKQAAARVWLRMAPDERIAALDALPRHKQSRDWIKDGGKFIPYPATWLNGRRWEDEITSAQGKVPGRLSGPGWDRLV